MQQVPELPDLLKQLGKYERASIPVDLDDRLKALVEQFQAGDPSALLVGPHEQGRLARMLLAFSERSASLAVRSGSEDHVVVGLSAIVASAPLLERANLGRRDLLMRLGPLLDAARRVSGNPKRLFVDAAAIASGPMSDVLTAFMEQGHEDPAGAMGYRIVEREDGLAYVWE